MKLRFLAGAALGYVFGTRAGRERYEQIVGSLRDLTDSDLVRQIKGEVTNLTGGGSSTTDRGLVSPPVIVGPGPDGKTGTKAGADVVLPDLETSNAASISGDTPAATAQGDTAKRIDPPAS
jgi:hypothetical protein